MVIVLLGCGSDNSNQIVELQRQITLLSRQLEEVRKDLDTLRADDKTAQQSLNTLEAEINRLKALETLPPSEPRINTEVAAQVVPGPGLGPQAPATQKRTTAKTPCPQIWALLGQGKEEEEIARALGTTVERVRTCEQEVGRGSLQR
jgi:hypothetical protein